MKWLTGSCADTSASPGGGGGTIEVSAPLRSLSTWESCSGRSPHALLRQPLMRTSAVAAMGASCFAATVKNADAVPPAGMLSNAHVAYQRCGVQPLCPVSDAAVSNGLPCGARTSRSTFGAASGPAFVIVAVYLTSPPTATAVVVATSSTDRSTAQAPQRPLFAFSAACCSGTYVRKREKGVPSASICALPSVTSCAPRSAPSGSRTYAAGPAAPSLPVLLRTSAPVAAVHSAEKHDLFGGAETPSTCTVCR